MIKYTIRHAATTKPTLLYVRIQEGIVQRIISDKRTLNKKIFDSKWESFPQVVQEAQIFFNSLHV